MQECKLGAKKREKMPNKPKSLTPMALNFVEQYLVDFNATQAAKRAGYADGSYGRQLIMQPRIKDAVKQAQTRIEQRTGITVNKVISALEEIHLKALEKNDLPSAIRALELLGKHVGAFERHNRQTERKVQVYMDFVGNKTLKVPHGGGGE